MANEIGFGTLGTGGQSVSNAGWLQLSNLYTAPAGASVKNLKLHGRKPSANASSEVTIVVVEMPSAEVVGMGTVVLDSDTYQWWEVAVDIPLTEGVEYGVSGYYPETAIVSEAPSAPNSSERSSWSPLPPAVGTVITGDGTTYDIALAIAGDVEVADPTPIVRKSSTFDITTTLGTITTATLNSVNVVDHVTRQVGTTVSFAGAATDEITTSGAYDLVLGDGVGTETITVQVNVFGVVPSDNPLKKDNVALASLANVQYRIISGTALNGTLLYYTGTGTTDAGGNIPTFDISDSALVATDPVLIEVLTSAGDSIIIAETVELI